MRGHTKRRHSVVLCKSAFEHRTPGDLTKYKPNPLHSFDEIISVTVFDTSLLDPVGPGQSALEGEVQCGRVFRWYRKEFHCHFIKAVETSWQLRKSEESRSWDMSAF